jgi:hypothetical protein
MAERFRRRLSELRTAEARGDGTDVRLVLLEAMRVEGRIHQLDEWVAELANDGPRGLISGLDDEDSGGLPELKRAWCGLDLQEATMRLRELEDLFRVLLEQSGLLEHTGNGGR